MTDVTVVISTYNRPRALLSALHGVRWQTRAPAKVLVIGDCCAPETGEALAKFEGLPLAYINLETRFGEQAGPNSVGAALADTRYIAFLNHDDLWLPDHLETSLATLEQNDADFVTSGAATARVDPEREDRGMFMEATPTNRRLSHAFAAAFNLFEPVSTWVMTTEASRRLKRWRPAATIYRAPIVDWVLRAWRAGLRHQDTNAVTVLKFGVDNSRRREGEFIYNAPAIELGQWIDAIETDGKTSFLARVDAEIAEAHARGLSRNFSDHTGTTRLKDELRRVLTPLNAARFRWTGNDVVDAACQRVGVERGWHLRGALRHRTGEVLPAPPDFDAALRFAAAQLAALDARA
jgi:hypothetical protein